MTQTLTVEFTPWLSRTLHLCAFPDVNVVFAFLHGSHVGSLVGSHVGIHVGNHVGSHVGNHVGIHVGNHVRRNVVSVFLWKLMVTFPYIIMTEFNSILRNTFQWFFFWRGRGDSWNIMQMIQLFLKETRLIIMCVKTNNNCCGSLFMKDFCPLCRIFTRVLQLLKIWLRIQLMIQWHR